MQSVELLLLHDQRRDVAAQADHLRNFAARTDDGGDLQLKILIIAAMETGADDAAGQSGVEGTIVGAENLGGAEGLVETASLRRGPAPIFEGRVGPGDPHMRTDAGNALAGH